MEEEDAKAQLLPYEWTNIKNFVNNFVINSLARIYEDKKDICGKIVGYERMTHTPDARCFNGECPSCQDICTDSQEGGQMWRCETGYNQYRKQKISCGSKKNDKTFCCCAATDRRF